MLAAYAERALANGDLALAAAQAQVRLRLCRTLSEQGRWEEFDAETAALAEELRAGVQERPGDPHTGRCWRGC